MPGEQTSHDQLFGLAAEFETAEEILHAARRVHAQGYRHAEAYTPFAVGGLSEALGFRRTRIAAYVLIGAIIGAASGFFMQWFANVVHLPWNIGGRPPNSWPAFIPITFELGILFAALAAVIGMLAMNKLPQPFHPMFRVEGFERASRDRFFLCIEAVDPQFDMKRTREALAELHPLSILEVPAR